MNCLMIRLWRIDISLIKKKREGIIEFKMGKRMKKGRKRSNTGKIIVLLFFIVVLLIGVKFIHKKDSKKIAETSFENNSNIAVEEKKEDSVATIVACGDTLCHMPVNKDAYNSETKEYDFSSIFKYIADKFKDKTVAVGNLETTLTGKQPYTGYPMFNSPEHLATDLKELGFDIMTTANNHALDRGYSGIVSTLDYLDNAGIAHTGTSRSKEEQDTILFKDLNGIKTAFLAFTYGTNGNAIPSGKEYCINIIDKDSIKQKIDKAKEEGAEAIVVSMHWGVEYQTKPNEEQKDLAEFLIKNDVNVILGCHPHVLEPLELKKVTMDDGTEKEALVIYSMGNFFSAQVYPNTRDTIILNAQVRKNGKTGKISIDKATYTPVYNLDNGVSAKDRFTLLNLDDIISSYQNGDGKWSKAKYDLAVTEKNRIEQIVGPEIDNTMNNNSTNSDANTDNVNIVDNSNNTENTEK